MIAFRHGDGPQGYRISSVYQRSRTPAFTEPPNMSTYVEKTTKPINRYRVVLRRRGTWVYRVALHVE